MVRLEPRTTTVIVVDVQEKLVKAMPEAAMSSLVRAATVLVDAAARLGARVMATEQYPAGLGATIPVIGEKLSQAKAPVLEKLDFAATGAPSFAHAFGAPRAAVIVGMETHVCVFQTVRELAARGIDVHVAIDGVASRREDHRATGLDLCCAAGATLTTMETVVFDWLVRAGTDDFKALSKLLR